MSDTRVCPYCAEAVRIEAVKCRHCGSYIGGRKRAPMDEWVRADSDRMIAGVCGGVANLVGLPTAVVRLAFVLGAFFGWGIVIYIVLWVVMPLEGDARRRIPREREDPDKRRDPEIERELGE